MTSEPRCSVAGPFGKVGTNDVSVEQGYESAKLARLSILGSLKRELGRLDAVSVTFEPGTCSVWHTHPLGQLLVVTAGCGLAQVEGNPVVKICPGDVVWIPPGVKH